MDNSGRRKSTTTPGGSANDLTNYFLDDLKCMVCQQIPIELLECTNCNKILCQHCQSRICQKSMVGTSLEEMAEQPQMDLSSNGKVCPNCKDESFKFQYIKSKIVKSLLANLKVEHKCPFTDAKKYQYDDLKRHILADCDHFEYQCRLCLKVQQIQSEEQKQEADSKQRLIEDDIANPKKKIDIIPSINLSGVKSNQLDVPLSKSQPIVSF